jgi:hypothetical protein
MPAAWLPPLTVDQAARLERDRLLRIVIRFQILREHDSSLKTGTPMKSGGLFAIML